MVIKSLNLADIETAHYNPRRDLTPDDPEYQRIKKSIEKFGMVETMVYNQRTNRLVGGHQRVKVLKDLGKTEAMFTVIDLPEKEEKVLNVALNKTGGGWDFPKLKDLIAEIDTGELDIELTGFDNNELQELFGYVRTDQDIDPVEIESYNQGYNFIIKCSDANELRRVQQHLGVNGTKMKAEDFMNSL